MSQEESLKLSEFLSRLYYEKLTECGRIVNFSSFLRVACTTYLNNKEHVKLERD
ncbi:ribbon-helix-helix domain-containing protein [Shewanella sp. E94]|uniref:ribbon-helix-helix domain-containing protein n=1 Tax=Shewanella sp. E94 TaxID=2746933 RepID=UPI0022BA544F|nr:MULTISPECIES: ribbon-helix-helix domain-containing protein [unclassified Shewanella]